jgi:hypothetical protein
MFLVQGISGDQLSYVARGDRLELLKRMNFFIFLVYGIRRYEFPNVACRDILELFKNMKSTMLLVGMGLHSEKT